jgi:uncharacterized membrane protein SpoIIM required for sporulation
MHLSAFIAEREPVWRELDALLLRAGQRPEQIGGAGVLRLAECYRGASADVAYARRAFPGSPTTAHLEALVGRGRRAVYGTQRTRRSPVSLFANDYWRLLAARPWPLVLAAAFTFLPTLVTALWALHDPGAASGLVPPEMRSVVEPMPAGGLDLSASDSSAFATSIFTNNLTVTATALAYGVALGLGTVWVLATNGVLLGTLLGLAAGAGNGEIFLRLVVAHGLLELTCIVVAGAAGLRIGWAIVEGGARPRGEALAAEAVDAVRIVLGTAPWLVLAGIVEGYVTPRALSLPAALGVGLALAVPYWTLLVWRGFLPVRRDRATSP